MRQRKMKQRKSKQSKSLAKILTLGIAAATVVSSISVPGGLLAPETVYADDNTGTAESRDQGTEGRPSGQAPSCAGPAREKGPTAGFRWQRRYTAGSWA